MATSDNAERAPCRAPVPLIVKQLRAIPESASQRDEAAYEVRCLRQFLVLSTSALALIQGIMSRSLAPTSSIGWAA